MKVKGGFGLRQVGAKTLVVPIGEQIVDFNRLITLNDAGAFLWKQLEQDRTEEDLLEALLAEYDVSREQAAADIAAFVQKLAAEDLLA